MRVGKKTNEWIKASDELEEIYLQKGITTCELQLEGCWKNNALHFAHQYKRNDPRCEHTFEGTILACNKCHSIIEYDRELTEKMFKKLRGAQWRSKIS